MGGFRDKVSGRTKIATWLAYRRRMSGLLTKRQQEERGMYVRFPKNKREAYSIMTRSDDGSGWDLWYHFHS